MHALRIGDRSAEVGNWQRFLAEHDYVDASGSILVADEFFGGKTLWCTKNYQLFEHLPDTGELDDVTRGNAELHGFMPFVQAKSCNVLWPQKREHPNVIVIHTMESPEKPHTAMNVAQWFAGESAPQASAHFCVDDSQTIQCVRESDVAWHAPGANRFGIGIEHAGFAAQTENDWDDSYSRAVLERSADLSATLALRYGIPVAKLSPYELATGQIAAGFAGHVDFTVALNAGHGHTDPGPNFPWNAYLARVQELVTQRKRIS